MSNPFTIVVEPPPEVLVVIEPVEPPCPTPVDILVSPCPQGPEGPTGPQGPRGTGLATFFDPVAQAPVSGTERWYAPWDLTLDRVIVSAGAPSSIVIDVHLHADDLDLVGTTIFTNQAGRPALVGSQHDEAVPDVLDMPAGSFLTVDEDSGDATGLTVQVIFAE